MGLVQMKAINIAPVDTEGRITLTQELMELSPGLLLEPLQEGCFDVFVRPKPTPIYLFLKLAEHMEVTW
jgi:hypothetical protein